MEGFDYSSLNPTVLAPSDVNSCSLECQGSLDCEIFAFSKSRKLCWLKSKTGAPAVNSDMISGFKTRTGLLEQYLLNFNSDSSSSLAARNYFVIWTLRHFVNRRLVNRRLVNRRLVNLIIKCQFINRQLVN